MKQLVCEMCGGKDLVKQDSEFVSMAAQILSNSIFPMGLAGITKTGKKENQQ